LKTFFTFLILIAFFASENITPGGFQLNEHGAKPMGMGGAFTAIANDASAIYWNGAGLTQIAGTQLVLGTALISPVTSFRGVSPQITEYKMEKQTFFPSHVFAAFRANEKIVWGIGITTPYGLGTKWDENWIGRYLAVETELMTFAFMPTWAFSVTDDFSISAGFQYSYATVTITRKNSQAPFAGDAFITLDGDDKEAFGYQFGLMYKPLKNLSIGASYHSEVNYKFKGTADAAGAQQLIDAKRIPNNADIEAKLTTPMNIAVGLAFDPISQLTLSVDYQFVGWSSYDVLAVNFTDPAYTDLASPRDYEDTYAARFGVEYRLSPALSLLGGIYYDHRPVSPSKVNPSLPDANRLGLSGGFDFKVSPKFGIAASYLFISSDENTITDSHENYTSGIAPFNGTYNSIANLFSLSLTYSL
jgi:long-chain fatty acid transport protein